MPLWNFPWCLHCGRERKNLVFLHAQLRNFRVVLHIYSALYMVNINISFSWRNKHLQFLQIWLLVSDKWCRNAWIKLSCGESSSDFSSTMQEQKKEKLWSGNPFKETELRGPVSKGASTLWPWVVKYLFTDTHPDPTLTALCSPLLENHRCPLL